MSSTRIATLSLVSIAAVTLGCATQTDEPPSSSSAAGASTGTSDASKAPATPSEIKGSVVETIDTAGYTYVLINTGDDEVWAAAPAFAVTEGDEVTVAEPMAMVDYTSKTLERTFDVVYFSGSIRNANQPAGTPALPAGHPSLTADKPEEPVIAAIEKTEADLTVEMVFLQKDTLVGSKIEIVGRVTRYSPGILGKNWLHIQDGSGSSADGSDDLTITTDATVAVGDIVTVTGVLVADKDFGSGYAYDLIIEDAQITSE